MRTILYILLLLPFIGNAQIKLHGNANEVFTGAYYHNYINSSNDTTVTVNPTDANIVIKNFSGIASGASVGSTTSLAMFRNSSFNGIMMGSFGSSPANGFSFYAWGGDNVTRTVTPASAQFLIMGFNGYDGSSSASAGLVQFIAPSLWTNTTGGHLMNFEIRATSNTDNTARPRIFWNSSLESLYGNSRGTGRFALGLFEITRPYAKFHVDGTNVLDTIAYYRALTGNRSPFALYSVGNTLVASIDSAGNHIVPKVFVTNATTATDVDSIVVRQNGEYVPALATTVLGGKVDSVTKSNDTFYYWKGATKHFAGLDNTGSAGAISWGDIGGTVSDQTDLQTALDGKVDENAAITGATKTKITYDAKGLVTAGADLSASDMPTGIDAAKIADGSVSNAEFQYIGGLTSDAQTQINGKAASSHTHAQSDITNLTTDLAAKQASDADLTAIAGLSPTNDDIIQRKAGAWTNRTMAQLKTDLALVKGDVGLGNVDNTSDATKNSAVAVLTNKDLTSGTNTFPTFNQNTTGSAATLTTTRTIWGQNFNGSANVSGTLAMGTADITSTGSISSTGSRLTKIWAVDGEFTNAPTVGGVALPTATSTTTLTNKTLTSPVISSISNTGTLTLPTVTATITAYKETTTASSATPTPTGDAKDNYMDITALATAPTFAAPSGTPANHNTLLIRIKDNGTARALTWNAIYRAGTDFALPTTTTINKTMYVQFVYNSADSKWDCTGKSDGY